VIDLCAVRATIALNESSTVKMEFVERETPERQTQSKGHFVLRSSFKYSTGACRLSAGPFDLRVERTRELGLLSEE
jgi:hypothetical protein